MSAIPCVTKVHKHTYVAGFQFNKGRSYRCFYQSPDGAIHAFFTDDYGAEWKGGDMQTMVAPGKAMLPTPMASVIYTENSTSNSRTFYLGKDHKVRMFGVTGGKPSDVEVNDGAYTAASYSKLGAIAWVENDIPHIRVYFQTPEDTIQELCWDGHGTSFSTGHTFPKPLKGTALAFLNRGSRGGRPSIRGYYQHSDRRIMEVCWDGGWSEGSLINGNRKVENQAHIAASVSTAGQMNVYWTNASGKKHTVTECVWEDGTGWSEPRQIAVATGQSSSRLLTTSHVPENENETRVRLFFLAPDGRVADARRENGHWGWGGERGGDTKWQKA